MGTRQGRGVFPGPFFRLVNRMVLNFFPRTNRLACIVIPFWPLNLTSKQQITLTGDFPVSSLFFCPLYIHTHTYTNRRDQIHKAWFTIDARLCDALRRVTGSPYKMIQTRVATLEQTRSLFERCVASRQASKSFCMDFRLRVATRRTSIVNQALGKFRDAWM